MKREYLVSGIKKKKKYASVPTESWLESRQSPTAAWLEHDRYTGHDLMWDSLYSETSYLPLTPRYSQFLNKAPGLSAASLLPETPCSVETYEFHHAFFKSRDYFFLPWVVETMTIKSLYRVLK